MTSQHTSPPGLTRDMKETANINLDYEGKYGQQCNKTLVDMVSRHSVDFIQIH